MAITYCNMHVVHGRAPHVHLRTILPFYMHVARTLLLLLRTGRHPVVLSFRLSSFRLVR